MTPPWDFYLSCNQRFFILKIQPISDSCPAKYCFWYIFLYLEFFIYFLIVSCPCALISFTFSWLVHLCLVIVPSLVYLVCVFLRFSASSPSFMFMFSLCLFWCAFLACFWTLLFSSALFSSLVCIWLQFLWTQFSNSVHVSLLELYPLVPLPWRGTHRLQNLSTP